MKKQFKNPIFKSVLLLLSVVLLVASAVIIATAVDASYKNPRTLTLNFDPNQVSSCTVYHEVNGEMVECAVVTESGQTVTFEGGVTVMVTVSPKNGLWPEFDVQGQAAETEGCVALWSSFKENSVLTVSCINREYIIHALDYDRRDINDVAPGELKIPYAYTVLGDGWTKSDLTSGVIKYRVDSVVELPEVEMEDYDFGGWYIITGSGTGEDNVLLIEETIPEGETKAGYYIPQNLNMTQYMYSQHGYIEVYPKLTPKSYVIHRIDIVHDTGFPQHIKTPIHRETMNADAKSSYLANAEKFWSDDPTDGGFKKYTGYYFVSSCGETNSCNLSQSGQVLDSTLNPDTTNVVYRFYKPIVYTLTYYDDDEATLLNFGGPSEYTYSQKTEIGQPSRIGYNFAGWKVQVYKDGQWTDEYLGAVTEAGNDYGKYFLGNKYVNYDKDTNTFENNNAVYASEANESGDYEIRLIAQWEPIDIKIEYDLAVDANLVANKGDFQEGGKFTTFKYDAGIIIDNPVRTGWMFTGWEMAYADGSALPTDIGLSKLNDNQYQITGSIHAKNIRLTATWAPETYTVVLDANGDGVPEFTISNVEYGSTSWVSKIPADLAAPTKEGYTFSGYWGNGNQYIYAVDGKLFAENIAWNIDGGANGATITLNAEWTINRYTITLDSIEGLPAGNDFTIKVVVGTTAENYTAFPVSFELDYNTTFRVEIKLSNNLRIAKWNGEKAEYYTGEWFASGNITVGAENMTLTAQARPAKPNIGAGQDVDITVKSETEIQVDFKNADIAKLYDVAISNKESEEGLEWHRVADGETQYVFTGLDQGTKYFVFVRFSKTETTLEGIPHYKDKTTNFINYVKDIENQLKDLITDDDGNCVKVLIDKAIDEIYDLIPEDGDLPDDFKALVDAIVAAVKEKLAFARLQDSKIAELQAYRTECGASGSFTTNNLDKIGSLCAQAVADISVATTSEQVEEIYNTAMAAIKAVPVTYLRDTNNSITLESLIGLNHDSSITLSSIEDIKALRRAIADAIAAGKITADSFITVEAATELLRTLDTVRAYSFNLINVQVSEGDVFTLTFTIPESLINHTGLQVAYFNQATGMLELLETTREGNTLIFKAKHIADFVILADPTVDLTAVIIALGVILFCQLIAIALVLISRSKAKNSVMHASVALPMFLTIHFLPVANAELIALGLGAAVLVAQIVLMWLLLSSGMIRVFKTKGTTPAKQEVTAVVREEDLHEDPYAAFDEEPVAVEADEAVEEVIDEVTQEVLDEIAEEFIEEATEEPVEEALDEDAFDEELAEELAEEQAEEYTDEAYSEEEYAEEESYAEEEYANEAHTEEAYAQYDEEVAEEALPEETEEVYDDEEFIEHAPETYYSTDDEEDVYAYDEEEAERVSDAPEATEAAGETAYDTDLFAGVFGESDEPDGDSSDEGGDPLYEESYDESYEYADAEDAPTEDADREETEGQGTVDPYAYVVEDDGEEISDDEEMYRYDE